MDNQSNLTNTTSNSVTIGTYLVLCLSAVGCVENGLIVIMLFTRPLLRKRPHVVFVLSLSISDLLSSVIVIMIVTARFYQEVMYTQSFCLFTYIGSVVCFGMSLIQALVISLERTLAVSSSTPYIRSFQGKRKYLFVIGACAILCLYTIILVASFPISGPVVGCVVELMYDRRSYVGIHLGVQSIFIPLLFATLLLYAIATCGLRKRMKKVGFMNQDRLHGTSAVSSNTSGRLRAIGGRNPGTGDDSKSQESTRPGGDASCSTQNTLGASNSGACTAVFGTSKGIAITGDVAFNNRTFPETNITSADNPSINRTENTSSLPGLTTSTQETKILKNEMISTRKLKSALKTVSVVQLCLVVCFVPSSVWQILSVFDVNTGVFAAIASVLPILHPLLNPVLYVWLVKELRKELCCRSF